MKDEEERKDVREKEKEEFERKRDEKEKGGGGIAEPCKREENLNCEPEQGSDERPRKGREKTNTHQNSILFRHLASPTPSQP